MASNEYTPLMAGIRRRSTADFYLPVERSLTRTGTSPTAFSRISHAYDSAYKACYLSLGNSLGRFGELIAMVLFCSPTTVLLPAVPICMMTGLMGSSDTAIFVWSLLAIIPLSAILGAATEALAEQVGDTLGGLLNASFGNAVELIVSYFALKQGNIRIVQTSLIGSVLSNLLLVLGCCFIAGGCRGGEQHFNKGGSDAMSSLLSFACATIILTAALAFAAPGAVTAPVDGQTADQVAEATLSRVLSLSRVTSVVLLFCYGLYLIFQLYTHSDLFEKAKSDDEPAENLLVETAKASLDSAKANYAIACALPQGMGEAAVSAAAKAVASNEEILRRLQEPVEEVEEEEEEENSWETPFSTLEGVLVLVITTIIIGYCAEILVDSINGMVNGSGISEIFIGIILLPVVGNAAEHVTAVVVAYKQKMDLAIQVAVGSSLQIILLVLPAMVLLGWAIGQPMSLHFELFETVVFFVTMLTVNYLLSDGKSNYLEGAMCLCFYFIIGVAFFIYPENGPSMTLVQVAEAARALVSA